MTHRRPRPRRSGYQPDVEALSLDQHRQDDVNDAASLATCGLHGVRRRQSERAAD